VSVGAPPRTVFLDAGVIIDGCLSYWSISKALLILAAQYPHHDTILLADAIDAEVQAAMQRKAQRLGGRARAELLATYPTWLTRVTLQRLALPDQATIAQYVRQILPIIRHANDLPAVVSAIQAHPDWVLSTNTRHWNRRLATATHLRIVHPTAFLEHLSATRP
jgi:hypothetical protein